MKTSSFTLPDDLDAEEEEKEHAVPQTAAAPEPEPAAAEASDEQGADAVLAAALMNGSKKKARKGKRAAFVLPEEPEAAPEDVSPTEVADSIPPEAEPPAPDGAAVADDVDEPQPAAALQEPADGVPVFGKKKKKKTTDAASLFAALDLDANGAIDSSADAAPGKCLYTCHVVPRGRSALPELA